MCNNLLNYAYKRSKEKYILISGNNLLWVLNFLIWKRLRSF